FPLVAEFAQRKGVAMRVDREVRGLPDVAVTSTEGVSSAFYGDEIDEALFLKVLDDSAAKGERSLEVMAHPAFVDEIVRKSAYC
ncbi:chitooligosaccharide deacetylase, partial [Klebsiella pneumoniae]|nr:chitooligosaccharide deacetylase [Klebsiella pneumoniae]